MHMHRQVPDVTAGDLLQAGPFHASTNDRVDDAPGLGPDGPPGEGSGDDGQRKRRKACFPRFSMCAGDFVELYRRKPSASGSSGGSSGSAGAAGVAPPPPGPASSATSVDGGAEAEGDEEEEDGDGLWDAVVTCFFVDTAPVAMEYIDTIHSMLR